MRLLTFLIIILMSISVARAQSTGGNTPTDVKEPETYISKEQYDKMHHRYSGEDSRVYPDFESMEGESDDVYAGRYDNYPPKEDPEEERRREQRRREIAGDIIYTFAQVGLAIICSWAWR